MTSAPTSAVAKTAKPEWLADLSPFEHPSRNRAIWQLANTFVPYIFLWFVMVRTIQLGYSYWITLALSVVAAGFMIRIFIFFHDCGHGSFFASQRANRILGYVTGIVTFTPYENWRYTHSIHHATAGDLDRRGVGDIWTMTVEEYQAAPRSTRLLYRFVRNPLVTFGLGPIFMFLISHRLTYKEGKRRHRVSVYLTNLSLLAIVLVASLTIGLRTYLLIQLPILLIGGAAGIWLFYIQHQFDGVYWARHEVWDPIKAGLEGSSYYRLPKILQWFTGNIGLHHIHHLRLRIPNYNLQRCFDRVPAMQAVKPLTIVDSLKCVRLNLWDEKRQMLVSFRSLRPLPQQGSL